MHKLLGPAALTLGVLLLGGCAAAHRGPLTTPLTNGGDRARDSGSQPLDTNDSTEQNVVPQQPLKNPQPTPTPPRPSNFGATIESADPGLAAALLAATVLPTAESDVRVAQEYRRLGVLDSAVTSLERALVREPRLAEAHEALARVWRDWGLPDLGLGPAYRAAFYDPLSASAQNTLGTLLDALGRTDDARAAYGRAIALDPTAGWAFNNLCYLEFRLGRLSEARSRCEAALQAMPGLAAAHNNLALTHAADGDLAEATREFFAAGTAEAANYNMGIVYLAQGEHRLAAAAFERAIAARPSFTAAKERAHAARLRLLTGGA